MLVLVSCTGGGTPQRVEDCDDPACRLAVAEVVWAQGPDAAAGAIASLPSPEEQVAAINHLAELHPGETGPLCRALPPGGARVRCEAINARPHLSHRDAVAPTWARRPGSGPARTFLAPPSASLLPLPPAVEVSTCAKNADRVGCVTEAAQAAARGGDVYLAAGTCAGLDTALWRDECVFVAAGAAGFLGGTGGYSAALPLCLQSGSFAGNCLAHASILSAMNAPDATSTDPAAWAALAAVGDEIGSSWAGIAPAFGAIAVDRFWSDALFLAYAESPQPTGAPAAMLPEAAHPHVRASLALRLVALGPTEGRSLDQWVDAAAAAFGAQPTTTHVRSGRGVDLLGPGWPLDLPGEESRPAVHLGGTARRTTAPDARDDLTICLLEALARRQPPADDLLRQGLTSDAEPVRWTAGRLLEHRTQRPPSRSDPSDGVQ